MRINYANMKKDEIIRRSWFVCEHSHTGLEHPQCYDATFSDRDKIAFFDIESGLSLTADFGIMMSYCIKHMDGKLISNIITPKEIRDKKVRDKRLLLDLCKHLRDVDLIVTYYGGDKSRRHDLPFTRTRIVKWNIEDEFPVHKEKKYVDVYDIMKWKFKIYRRRMEDACRVFGIPCKAHPLTPDIWQDALLSADKGALEYILEHNKEDVISLELLFKKVFPYKETRTSI